MGLRKPRALTKWLRGRLLSTNSKNRRDGSAGSPICFIELFNYEKDKEISRRGGTTEAGG